MSSPLTKIALVDDHSLLRNGLATIINSFDGYNVIFEADNGKDFIEQLKHQTQPDIVLLDITMPEMNGFETAAWIKQNTPDIKVLVLSMMDNESAIITMLKSGARGYVLKDSKPAIFHQALDSIRDRGFFLNDLVGSKMLNYVMGDESAGSTRAHQLSEKEIRFLKLSCTEKTYKEIANEMDLSPRTIEGYRDELFKKLSIQSRVGLVLFAIKNGYHRL